ncbi:MAG: hypothetical protein ABIS50_03720 [Luteolibacter sp.]|uniref:hypothetical protein n=1 Tax=Luteolibacter sp. TaxID=1962973 RepID=UPI0032673658
MTDTEQPQDSLFELIEQGDEDLCRTLWLGVILQAVLDAKGKFGNLVTQNQARNWLNGNGGNTSEFAAVCELAGVDFEKTRSRCLELLAVDSPAIDFRMMKQDRKRNRWNENRKVFFQRARRRDRIRRRNQESDNKLNTTIAANDNLPSPSNDNRLNDNLINQPTETK